MLENSYYEIVLYGVPWNLTDDLFSEMLKSDYRCVLSARRILRYPDREPTTLVRVRLNSRQSQQIFLRNGLEIGDFWFSTQRSRTRSNKRRCYKCQRIGLHLSRNCSFEKRCVKCAGDHFVQECDSVTEKCANCDGPHSADSRTCQHWVQISQHGIENSGEVTHQKLMNSINEVEIMLTENMKNIQKKFESIESSLDELKFSNVSLMTSKSLILPTVSGDDPPRPCEFQPPTADEPSAATDRPPADLPACLTTITPRATVTQNNPDYDNHLPGHEPTCFSFSAASTNELCSSVESRVDIPEYVECFRMETDVNSDEKESDIASDSDTVVDANYIKSDNERSEWYDPSWNPDDDPVYNAYQERMMQLPEAIRDEFQALWNPYLCEVLFRYSGGTIGKTIHVIAIDGTIINEWPCDIGIKTLKDLKCEQVRCCPFHHLATVIRDSIDKSDFAGSLRKWRMKDLTPFGDEWQDLHFP